MTTRAHGDRNRYLRGPNEHDQPGKGCRCKRCRAANAAHQNRRRLAIDTGRHRFMVDAEPTRQHVQALKQAGLSYNRVAQIAGVPTETVNRLLYGKPSAGLAPTRRLAAARAEALLAVRATQLPTDGWVPAIGTQRRLQALAAIGWSTAELARRVGASRHPLSLLMRAGPGRRVTVETVLRVRKAYDELWDVDPATAGMDAGSAMVIRGRSAKKGWVPPMAWDDDTIDDPAATPDLGDKAPRTLALYEDSEELLAQGATLEQAAGRLDVKTNSLQIARDRAKRQVAV